MRPISLSTLEAQALGGFALALIGIAAYSGYGHGQINATNQLANEIINAHPDRRFGIAYDRLHGKGSYAKAKFELARDKSTVISTGELRDLLAEGGVNGF